ncbi:MAG: ABC transporter permease [Terriglobales bacterium]
MSETSVEPETLAAAPANGGGGAARRSTPRAGSSGLSRIWRMAWMNVLLSYRVKIAFFFTFVWPMMFFFVYFVFFAGSKPLTVAALFGPLISFEILSNALFGFSSQLVSMRERDMLRRYHLAPISATTMVGSRMLSSYLLFLPLVVLQYLLAMWWFQMPVRGNLLVLFLVFTLAFLALSAIGLVVACIVDTFQEATVWNQILFFGLLFLTGTTLPLLQLPQAIQRLALFLPPTLMILSSAMVMLGGTGWGPNWAEIIGLLLIMFSCWGLGVALFRWEKEKKSSARDRRRAALALVPILAVGLWLNLSPGFQRVYQSYLQESAAAFTAAVKK